MKTQTKIKSYFIIINLVISIIAFSCLVNADCSGGTCTPDPPATTPPSTTTPTTPGTGFVQPPGSSVIGVGNNNQSGPPDAGGDPGDSGVPGSGNGETEVGLTQTLGGANWMMIFQKAAFLGGIGGTLGAMTQADEGQKWGQIAGAVGGVVMGLLESSGLGQTESFFVGLGVAAAIFAYMYKISSIEIVEFHCLPWQAPVGGEDCSLCQEFEDCSEYTCKSLGQACDIINSGTKQQKCVWMNPHDVKSPKIKFEKVNKDLTYKPDNTIRPPATGVIINRKTEECIQAFTPLEFEFTTDEPAQCKIDYNLTTGFDEMSFYVGGDSLFIYNHTETLSLPGPNAVNAIAPELKNDGVYTLFVRCQDANGNYNQDAYSVNFCVDKGPDTTPPKIVNVNIPSGNPVLYDQINLDLEVYVNEPSECKWDREDRDYKDMSNEMICNKNVWEMNSQNVYTCKAKLTGMENRKENKYYFKCKDQPMASEGDRNTNVQSYLYTVMGTQPLNLLKMTPTDKTISGATDVIPIFLEIKTDNGYDNGESLCYYSASEPNSEEDYLLFSDTKSNIHLQRQDLPQGNYEYYFKCVDLGGNTVYNKTTFKVETDRQTPMVIRTYREGGELKVMTNEESECTYSINDCNFEIEEGISMTTFDSKSHTAGWVTNQNYFIRCKDEFNNQPYPNVCSIVLRAANLRENVGVIVL